MGTCHIRFMKTLYDPWGHRHECVQDDVVIRRAKSVPRAVEAAKLRFQRRLKTAHWWTHADYVDVETKDGDRRGFTGAPGWARPPEA